MIRAKNLPKNPGPAAWNMLLSPPAPPQHLATSVTADWVIIGGGFAGLSAARRLTQICGSDETIAVIEAGRIGDGPAGRNSGFMIDLPHVLSSEDYAGDMADDILQIKMNRHAINFALEAASEYGLDDEIVCQSGKINAAATTKGEAHNIAYAEHLKKLGEPCEMLDAQSMAAVCGTSYYQQGLYTPGTVMLHPAAYIRGLADGLSKAKVNIFENSPVTSMNRKNGVWHIMTNTGGTITAPKVIMAVNGHVESFGFFKRRLMHVFLYASMTRRLDQNETKLIGGTPRWGVTPSDPMGSTIRRISGRSGDRIIVRNQATFAASMEVSTATSDDKRPHHKNSFANRFPSLADVEMEYSWGGKLCLSLNDVPAFGEIEDGMYSACCQNGLGTARGTLTGIIAADLATGHTPTNQPEEQPEEQHENQQILERLFAYAPPKKLPPEPFASIGAALTLKYREWRAGREI